MSSAREALRQARLLLRLGTDDVERSLGLTPGCLAAIEDGHVALETALLDELAVFYGLHPADVAQARPIETSLAAVRELIEASAADLAPSLWSDIARIAAVREDVKRLERALVKPDRYMVLYTFFGQKKEDETTEIEQRDRATWRKTMALVGKVRAHQQIDPEDPVPSMRDLVAGLGIELVCAEFADARVAAFALRDAAHGPTIVLNLSGANASPCVRRRTIAQQICHLLQDETTRRPGVQFYESAGTATADPIATMADHFADALLAPDHAVRRDRQRMKREKLSVAAQVQQLMDRFGISFETACRRLRHAGGLSDGEIQALEPVALDARRLSEWSTAEATVADADVRWGSVPADRRGYVGRLVLEAWRSKSIDRRQAIDLLQAAPDEHLEDLLGLVPD